jgi:hypothetical protein
MNDLNLLPSQAKFQAERMRLKGIINNFLWIFGGIWVLLVVVIILLNIILTLTLKKFNKDYEKVSNQYKELAENMALNQKIKYQAKVVGKVLSDRFEYGKSMKLVKELFSEKIKIDNLEINEFKKFEVNGSIPNGEDLKEVEKEIDYINNGLIEGIASAEIRDVSVDAVKGWKFVLEVKLK